MRETPGQRILRTMHDSLMRKLSPEAKSKMRKTIDTALPSFSESNSEKLIRVAAYRAAQKKFNECSRNPMGNPFYEISEDEAAALVNEQLPKVIADYKAQGKIPAMPGALTGRGRSGRG